MVIAHQPNKQGGIAAVGPCFCLVADRENSNTTSIPNYKTSQEFWRVKTISSLIKIIERNIKIYNIKLMYYENKTNKESNDT